MLMTSLLCSCSLVDRNVVDENQKKVYLNFSLISKMLLTLPKVNLAWKCLGTTAIG